MANCRIDRAKLQEAIDYVLFWSGPKAGMDGINRFTAQMCAQGEFGLNEIEESILLNATQQE